MNTLLKNILFAIMLGLFLYFGYTFFIKSPLVPTSITSFSSERLDANGNPIPGSGLLSKLQQMGAVRLDPTIFGDQSFQNLKDFGVAIKNWPVGRPNPFAVIGSDRRGTATSSKSASDSASDTTNDTLEIPTDFN